MAAEVTSTGPITDAPLATGTPTNGHNGTNPAGALYAIWTPTCYPSIACYPWGWEEYWYSKEGYYSPGICPQGFTSGCQPWSTVQGPPIEPTETAIQCVLSGYSCDPADPSRAVSSGSFYPMIQVRWASADLPLLETHPLTPGLVLNAMPQTANPAALETEVAAEEKKIEAEEEETEHLEIGIEAVLGAMGAVGTFALVWYKKLKGGYGTLQGLRGQPVMAQIKALTGHAAPPPPPPEASGGAAPAHGQAGADLDAPLAEKSLQNGGEPRWDWRKDSNTTAVFDHPGRGMSVSKPGGGASPVPRDGAAAEAQSGVHDPESFWNYLYNLYGHLRHNNGTPRPSQGEFGSSIMEKDSGHFDPMRKPSAVPEVDHREYGGSATSVIGTDSSEQFKKGVRDQRGDDFSPL
ncbi:hypothetical protein BX600DRAFT_513802 [Xylariales sp. PMI_506]|nr:hypothetical protein BX600DRAFT_513802 [Xylariales sp. PMI_506]